MADIKPDIMHTPDGVFQAIAWARSLKDDELLAKAALGKAAHSPSVWALITVELGRRGLASPFLAAPDPQAEATLTAAVDSLTAAQDEKSKEADGAIAMWAFLGTAIVTLFGLGKLFSLGSLLYLVVGAFLSAIAFGIVAYGLRHLVLRVLASTRGPSDRMIAGIGMGLLILDVVIAVIATRWLTLSLFS